MEISIKTVNGKSINLEVDNTSDTIDLKIHGPTRQLVLRLGPDSGPDSGPDQEGVIRIFVSTFKGKTFEIEVEGTEIIENVKAKIHAQGGPPVNQQTLLFEGKQLLSRRTIADYCIKTGSTLLIKSPRCSC